MVCVCGRSTKELSGLYLVTYPEFRRALNKPVHLSCRCYLSTSLHNLLYLRKVSIFLELEELEFIVHCATNCPIKVNVTENRPNKQFNGKVVLESALKNLESFLKIK